MLKTYSSWSQQHSVPFNPSACSWSEVLEQLQKACEATAMAEMADTRFSRRNQRRMSIISKYLQPGLNGIPEMLSPFHGGLGMIFYVTPCAYLTSIRALLME